MNVLKFVSIITVPAGATLIAAALISPVHAEQWDATVGAESADRGSQALAYLPNEMWIHVGDSIRWAFPTHERHTLTFLKPGQIRPPGFGPIFGVAVGCPGITRDGSTFDGSACVTTGVVDDPNSPAYTVSFPTSGNFKFVCLLHADMTGVIHVLDLSQSLPHDQAFYDREAERQAAALLADASRLRGVDTAVEHKAGRGGIVAGAGQVITTTGGGSQTASLMRFLQDLIVVQVGDTVEWTSLDPSINHTVTFGTEPGDPRPPSGNVALDLDGARHAIIGSVSDRVNSGFLSPAPQDRPGLAQSPPGVTRFRVTFTSPGTYHYVCAVHDQLGMKGTVVVHP